MDRLLYRNIAGQIEHVAEGKLGQHLIVDQHGLGWQEFSATKVPYVDASRHALKTVADVLNFLMQTTHDLQTDFSRVNFDSYMKRISSLNEAVTTLRHQMISLQAAVATLDSMDHHPTQRGMSSDQPLSLMQAKRHGITKRLAEAGSYDNEVSGAKAQSVQGALDELFALVRLADVPHNMLTRDKESALHLDPISITNVPSPLPISQTGNRINISPAQIAHLRHTSGEGFPVVAGQWNELDSVFDVAVFDSLAASGSRMIGFSNDDLVMRTQRDGYYMIEASAPEHMVVVVVNGENKGVSTWRGMLSADSKISAALWSDVDVELTCEVNLFMQLLV